MKLVIFALLSLATAQAQIQRVVNAASFLSDDAIGAGSIISIFGQNLSATTAQAADVSNPPASLGGVRVTAGGKDAFLFYVSSRQVNARLDPATPSGSVILTVQSAAGTFSTTVAVSATPIPGVFAMNGAGTRDAAVLNAVTFASGPFGVTTNGQPTYLALFATGLDLSKPPVTVSVGGVATPVLFAGDAPCCKGLQQINIQLTPSLAGAGRVEVAVTAGGKTSNIVEVVILPSVGQGPFSPTDENQERSRELASIAWAPGTQLVLVTDENDDVVRVVDIKQRQVVQTITLPEGSSPAALAITNSSPQVAIVAERDSGKIAFLTGFGSATPNVAELAVGSGPSAIVILGLTAIVVNQDSDSVSIVDIAGQKVLATVTVGRGPRGVAVDGSRAYVTNESSGTVTVIDIGSRTVIANWSLGMNVRPQSIAVIPGVGGIVTEPTSTDAHVFLLNLVTGVATPVPNVNPDRSGGASDIAVYAPTNTVYLASQTAGSIIALKLAASGAVQTSVIRADIGTRALTIDTTDKLLIATNEGSGTLVLIDLNTNAVIDRVNGVRSENEKDGDKHDDHSDRDHAANMPTIASITPNSATAPATNIQFTVTGTNLTGATSVVFINPSDLPGKGHGNGKGRGLSNLSDPAFTVSNIQLNAAGTKLTAAVSIAGSAAKGTRLVRELTPSGESTLSLSNSNTFTVR